MGLAISTSWNSFIHTQGIKIIEEIKTLSFKEIELNFSLTSQILDEIASTVKDSDIKIVSLHNFCPIPEGLDRLKALPDYYSLASLDGDERKKAIQQTKLTIDTAAKLGAKAVVLHCGRIDIPDDTKKLIYLHRQGLKDSKDYKETLEKMFKNRSRYALKHFSHTLKSLDILNKYAQEKDVYLGIENRFYYYEIPSLEEIGKILTKFKGSSIKYWHDTGHAQVQENLGILKHLEFMELYKDDLLGIHLHDVKDTYDHLAPSKGEFDFRLISSYIKKETIKVMEAHQPATASDISEAKFYLEGIFDGKL